MQAPASPRRSPLVVTAVILAAVLGAFLLFSGIWTEKLWFDSIGFTGVFWTQLVTRAVLFLVGALVVGGLLWVNMALAFRSRPQHRRTGASAVLDRYRDLLEQNALAALALPAGVFGFMAGLSTATQTLPVLGWLNRQTSGVTDPTFGLDTTFFMLEYPVWRLAASLLMSGLVGLYALYARRVQLSTSSTNIGMQRAAEAAGFTCVARSAWFSLDLPE